MAFSEYGESFFVVFLGRSVDLLLGDVQQQCAIVVDQLGHSHCAGLVDCISIAKSASEVVALNQLEIVRGQ